MFPYKWKIKDGYPAKAVEKHGKTVFSTFACGGGSTMGYKLAGYEVLGANDIDPKMAKLYKENHKPKLYYLEDIRTLKERKDLPKELYNLDILDGSPPCSTFSTAGKREKDWGKEKMFREGQTKQILDDLFFEFVDLVSVLKPKVVIAENVSGIIKGNAKGYTLEIVEKLREAGYMTQVFLLNAATMGVPQRRQRVFFIGIQKELFKKKLEIAFNEKPIPFRDISDDSDKECTLTPLFKEYWFKAKQGDPVGTFKSLRKLNNNQPANTVTAANRNYHPTIPRTLNDIETIHIGSFPEDYDFCGLPVNYVIGMSVPPVMMANIAYTVYKQWLS